MSPNPDVSAPAEPSRSFRRARHSLGLRLTFLLAILLILLGALAAWSSARGVGDRLLDEARRQALRMADMVKRSTRYDMIHTRWDDIAQSVSDIGQQPGIERVRIYNKDRIVYSANADEVGASVGMEGEACYECHRLAPPLVHIDSAQRSWIEPGPEGGDRALGAIDVIYNEPGCVETGCHKPPSEHRVLGVVDVGVSLASIDQRISEAGTNTLAFGLGATALACAMIGFFVYSFVTRPVRGLLAGIRSVSAGELDTSLPVASNDEIGELAGAFNQMTVDLRKARGELEAWTETLEQQVEERTRDLKVAQAQVVRAEKLSSLGVLAAGVAHELNSPLTGILTFAHLLLQDAPQESQQQEDLQLIVNETQRCALIIRQLLQFSRESGPHKKIEDVVEIVRRALALVRHQAMFHTVKVETHFGPDVPKIPCDANQLQQVFLNLLLNAAEAMPHGGSVTIRVAAAPPEQVVLEFEDSGSGIPAEMLGKVFDPFFTSKEVGKGTGLGLSVSYGIVQQHGGTITVASEVGTGTKFTITLPVEVRAEVVG